MAQQITAPKPSFDDATIASLAGGRGKQWVVIVAQKLFYAACILLAVTMLVFFGLELLPGDAASAMLGTNATPASLAVLREQMGLNEPVISRYLEWLGGLLRGDLGVSPATRVPVATTLMPRLANTLVLAAIASVGTFIIAAALGIFTGRRAGSKSDSFLSGSSLFATAIPDFVSGLVLIFVFSYTLGMLPGTSLFSLSDSAMSHPSKLLLPAATLIISNIGYSSRMFRAGVADSLKSEYVEFAVLNGLPPKVILWRYAVRNALAPSIQVVSLTLLFMLSGVIVVETLFQYPGIGQMAVQATVARDFASIASLSVVVASLYVLINITTDALITFVSPLSRTKHGD